jgi:ABC-type polysaccharide/polyol phosphate export permease
MFLNPLAVIFQSYQAIFIYDKVPDLQALAVVAAISLLLCIGSVKLLRNRMGEVIDEL